MNVLKAMRYEDTANAKQKKKWKLKVLPGQCVAVDSSESSENSECEDLNVQSNNCCVSEESVVDCELEKTVIKSEKIDIGQANNNLEKVNPKNLKIGDWVVVNFIYASKKAGSLNRLSKKQTLAHLSANWFLYMHRKTKCLKQHF